MPPRPYQRAAVPAILHAFRDHRRVLFCLATGGGKTYITRWVAAAATRRARRTLFLTDRQSLTEQSAAELRAGIIMGDTVRDADAPVIASTWQTLAERPLLRAALDSDPWLVTCDEGDRWARGMVELLTNLPASCLALILTATPKRSDRGEGMSAICDTMVTGPSPRELIEQGWLTPFDVRDIGTGEGDLTTPEAIACAYDGWVPYADRSTVAICTHTAHAQAMVTHWRARGHFASLLVQDTPDRRALCRHVATHGGILCGVDIPGRGLDIPELGCLIDAARSSSWSAIIQRQGRLTRLFRRCESCGQHIQWGHLDCWVCGHVHAAERPEWKPRPVLLDQAGNWQRGLLDTIDAYEMDEPEVTERGECPAKMCPECGLVLALGDRVCPECGFTFPPPDLRPSAVGEWRDITREAQHWQWAVEEARHKGRQPAWVWHAMGSPGGRDAPELEMLRLAIGRLSTQARRAWVERVRDRMGGRRVWMAARVGFRP